MALLQKLPRILFGGPKIDGALEKWAGTIDYLNSMTGVFPVKVTKTASGPLVAVDLPPAPFLGKVTTAVTAGTGLGTLGSGVVTAMNRTGAALAADAGATGIPVLNFHEKGFALNSVVKVEWVSDAYYANDVGRCADYV